MSDPIEKLTRLGDAMEGAPMPLPASEIRARGDRIRRRKHAVIAGAGAAVVAAVAVPVVAFTIDDDTAPDRLAPQPTVTDPVEPGALGESNLLTGRDAIYPTGGAVDWRERKTVEGDGQATYSPCQQQSMAGLGAESVLQRDFSFVITETDEVDSANHLDEVIAEFPTAADAEAAYAEIRSWYDDCMPDGADRYDAGTFAPVAIDVDGQAEAQLSTYGPVDEGLDPTGDLGFLMETGLVLSGDRVAVLSQIIVGQDYNFDPDDRPVVRMLPVAAERLVLGGGSEPDGEPVEGEWVTEIPGDFPLTDGWPASDGSDEFQLDEPSVDNQAMAAAGDLPDCGQSVDGGDPVDRLTTRISWGSAYYARELQLFATPDDAAAFLDSLQDASSVCADQPGSSYELEPFDGRNLVVKSGEAIYRQVLMASQVDNAVLVAIQSDEGATDTETVDHLWTEVGENLAGVRSALGELLDGDQGTDAPAPSTDTAIPDDLPIDVDMADLRGDGGEYRTPYHPPATEQGVTVDLCGLRVWPAEGTADRLWAWATGPEYGDRRELVTFPTVDEAVGAVAAIRDGLQDCQGEGTTVWTVSDVDTGYDSVTFHRTYTQGLGHDAFQVTRVGRAVLLTLIYGEGSLSSIDSTNPVRTELTRTIAPNLCVFTESGCP